MVSVLLSHEPDQLSSSGAYLLEIIIAPQRKWSGIFSHTLSIISGACRLEIISTTFKDTSGLFHKIKCSIGV